MEPVTTEELLQEFVEMYKTTGLQSPPQDTEAIIVLTCDGATQDEEENLSRIRRARVALQSLPEGTPVYFNGVTEEAVYAVELMKKLGIPKDSVLFQDCGVRGVANTLTQFLIMSEDPRTKGLKSVVLVTSSYHIPRVRRTAAKHLPKHMNFVVLADMEDVVMFNPLLKVAGEIRRIIHYSQKGDILARMS